VLVPEPRDRGEGDRERQKAADDRHQLVEGPGHLDGDDEQRQREAEDGVAETFDARGFFRPPEHAQY
jgi:hypothetical protein